MANIISIIIGLIGIYLALYFYEKNNLIKDIKSVVTACRGRDSFDDKSEYKLSSWLEGAEDELHRKSLWKLIKIKKEMWRYLDIHIRMDLGENNEEL